MIAPTPPRETTGEYYIKVEDELADTITRVLKQGDTFAIVDQHCDIRHMGLG